MLTLSHIKKSYGGRILLEDASLQVNRNERIGLVGPNGVGKSTLFAIILKNDDPDEGTVSIQKGTTLGFLPQESASVNDETVLEIATGISPELVEVQKRRRIHANPNDPEHYTAEAQFAEVDGYTLEAKAKRILVGLAFSESDFHRPARGLSGGWIMRAHLARLLVQEPDFLMLDEPTNHLDLESLGWFQNYLLSYPGAILTISHDRAFLNALCDSIVEINHGRLHRYRGNYDAYCIEKAARQEQQLAAYQNQQREIAHLEAFVNRFRAKATKAAQAQERLKRLDKMVRIEAPERPDATVKFRFPQPIRSGQRVVTLQNITQAYGNRVVYQDLNFTVERGQRIVLVGPNGAGKSTLLKILAGLVPLQTGVRELGHNTSVGYFAQHRTEMLDAKQTILAEALDGVDGVGEEMVRTILGAFLFRREDVFKPVGVLSGGEKSRLALVKLLLRPPNLLLLDEPTTHLDIPSIDALVQALAHYQGTLVFVSHDVHFIRAAATSVLHVQAGCLTPYAGNYDYYLEKSRATSERDALVASLSNHQPCTTDTPQEPNKPKIGLKELKEQRRAEAEARQATAKLRRAREAALAALETKIHILEEQQHALAKTLEDPAIYQNTAEVMDRNRKLSDITTALEQAMEEWESFVTESSSH